MGVQGSVTTIPNDVLKMVFYQSNICTLVDMMRSDPKTMLTAIYPWKLKSDNRQNVNTSTCDQQLYKFSLDI